MTDILISVIVPIYNTQKYLRRCIESILNQTYTNLEVMLVDDGSTDASPMICKQYARKDDRILYKRKENGGVSDARNYGLQNAKGRYILFVDSDDYVEKDYIETLYTYAASSKADIVISDGYIERDNGSVDYVNELLSGSDKVLSSEETIHAFLQHRGLVASPWVMWGKLYKAILMNGVEFPKRKLSEDIAVLPGIIERAERVVYIPERKYHYVQRENSIVHTGSEKLICDNYYYSNKMREFVEYKYPALKEDVRVEYEWMCMQLFLSRQCKKDNIYKNIHKDLVKYSLSFLKSHRKFKYKVLCLGEVLFPGAVKRCVAMRKPTRWNV